MKNDLIATGVIFIAICFGINSFTHNLELKRVHKLLEMEKVSKLEVMKIALENDRSNKEYISVLLESRESLNVEIDLLNIDIIPELNENNINTLYGGELVINYLLQKNNGNLFEALKDFKGSEKNIYPVKESIKIYKELK